MKYLLLIVVFTVVAWAPTVNTGKQMLHDMRYRERDRIAVAFANDVQYWTAFYTWVQREGASK